MGELTIMSRPRRPARGSAELQQINIYIPASVHRRAKVAAAEQRLTFTEWATRAMLAALPAVPPTDDRSAA